MSPAGVLGASWHPRRVRDLTTSAWWVGGSPCSGKTTLATRLAEDLGAHLYSCDDAFDRHAAALTPGEAPTFAKVTSLSIEQRLSQAVAVQVDDVFALAREQRPLITADLRRLSGPVVVEGAALLPEALSRLGVSAQRAVWVVPTEEFQREHYARRAWAQQLVSNTSDPAVVFERWMQRDARFAVDIAEEARRCGYPVEVTGSAASLDTIYERVRRHLMTPAT